MLGSRNGQPRRNQPFRPQRQGRDILEALRPQAHQTVDRRRFPGVINRNGDNRRQQPGSAGKCNCAPVRARRSRPFRFQRSLQGMVEIGRGVRKPTQAVGVRIRGYPDSGDVAVIDPCLQGRRTPCGHHEDGPPAPCGRSEPLVGRGLDREGQDSGNAIRNHDRNTDAQIT